MKMQIAAGAFALAAGLAAAPLAHAVNSDVSKAGPAEASACHSPASASFMHDLTSRANQPGELAQLWHGITSKPAKSGEIEPLKIGQTTEGTLGASKQMVLVSNQPVERDHLILTVDKLGGKATTPIVVCLTDRKGNESLFSQTTMPGDAGTGWARFNLAGLKDKFVSVRIAPEGAGKFEYKVSTHAAA
jgi:hypothetical protein